MIRPWLWLPPRLAHDLSPIGLSLLSAFREPLVYQWRPLKWRDMIFQNPLGIAGGVDKNGSSIEDWWTFGPGFLEIGTITPQPQGPNPGRIIDRDRKAFALWNRMGFPGQGVEVVADHLRDLPPERSTPIFANIGKNRTTANEEAELDYAKCMEGLHGLVDAFVVNISSPNTQGLRDLLHPKALQKFLGSVLAYGNKLESTRTPILLKLSPDIDDSVLKSVVETSLNIGIDGFVATNTTLLRPKSVQFPVEGGLSGQPLAQRSKEVLQILTQIMGKNNRNTLIVSVGGVSSPEDVVERLDLGADLVQVYSSLVFEGPWFFKKVAHFIHDDR